MKRNFRKVLALVLAVLTLASCFSTMSFAVEYPGHEKHNTKIVKGYAATTCTDGLTDGVQCLACAGQPMIVAQEVIPAAHVVGGWTIEGGTVANCTTGYNMIKKCTKAGCGKILERKTINEHTYVTVSVNQPYCDVEGSIIKKCNVCGDQITQPAEVKAHVWGAWETKVIGSCTIDGYETRKCTQCLRVEEKKNAAPGHDYQIVEGSSKLPTCKEEGSEASWSCSACGDLKPGKKISKKKHVDSNNDNYCDNCETYYTADLPDGCDCPCHEKSGIRKVFFQIAIFFLSLFSVNATCGCGAVHYEVRKLF